MLKRLSLLLLLTLLILLLPTVAQAEDSLQATLAVDGEGYTVGDPIQITLNVIHPADYHLLPPALEQEWGDFTVTAISPPVIVSNPDGSETTTLILDLRAFAPGEFTTPPLILSLSDSTGQLHDLTAPGASVRVNSVLVEGDTELRDIKPQADLPYHNLLPWLLVGLLCAAALPGFLVWRHRRQVRQELAKRENRLPHEVAFDELKRIEKLDLPAFERYKEHFTLISDCLRLYIERSYQIPILERTTTEVRSSLKMTGMGSETSQNLLTLLDESDLVKFAKVHPDVESAYQALHSAHLFVEQTKPVLTVVDEDTLSNDHQVSTHDFASKGGYSHEERRS